MPWATQTPKSSTFGLSSAQTLQTAMQTASSCRRCQPVSRSSPTGCRQGPTSTHTRSGYAAIHKGDAGPTLLRSPTCERSASACVAALGRHGDRLVRRCRKDMLETLFSVPSFPDWVPSASDTQGDLQPRRSRTASALSRRNSVTHTHAAACRVSRGLAATHKPLLPHTTHQSRS